MQQFADVSSEEWVASAREEQTPRHHGRWFLVFHRPGDETSVLAMPEVRWQTRATAERTLRSMSAFELRRRLHIVRQRAQLETGASPRDGTPTTAARERTNANAG